MSQPTNNHSVPAGYTTQAIAALKRDPLAFKSVTLSWFFRNTHVWETFATMATELRNRGCNHGAKCIYETMRYNTAVTDADITFKLDNSYVSGLARLYNAVIGQDYFETREQ